MSAEIRNQASQAAGGIRALRYLATRGDAQAAADLLALAVEAAGHVNALATHPPGTKSRIAMDEVVGTARQWPISIPAIEELRPEALSQIPANLGATLPMRVEKGPTKPRDFHSYTGLAESAFWDMHTIRERKSDSVREALRNVWELLPEAMQNDWRNMAILLPELTRSEKSIECWKEAGTRWAEDQCQGQWKSFPWPEKIILRANQKTNSRKRGLESAVKEYLGKGFESIARRVTLIPPE